jgi:hypothetical protein
MKRPLLSFACGLTLALAGTTVQAQTGPPVLNPPVTVPAPTPVFNDTYQLGRTYRIETVQGTTFTGQLVSMSLTTLEFDAAELGHVRFEREQIRRADLVGQALPAPRGPVEPGVASRRSDYYDIGNGNRLFFAPTARGLRKGEGTLQDVDVYLVGVNYGITDNFSLGGYVSVMPFLSPNEQFLVLTPKFSFPLSEKVHVGAGLLYVRVPNFDSNGGGTGAGIGYGAITYGSADNNLTFGLGYGFVEGNIGSTPILQIGGQTRVSRRISLISENYIVADSKAGMGGLYGIKINWRRTSLGLGALYFYSFPYDEKSSYTYYNNNGQPVNYSQTFRSGGEGFATYVVPVYIDFTFRFGKGAKR